jgi:hypothetical protein
MKNRFIGVSFQVDKITKRVAFPCCEKILLALLAKSGRDMSHLEQAFVDAYITTVT